ncbi:potassium uptake protein, TrkH family [Saccharopolyspora kobensis]|uniref:Potassium uptake protein, TrkH family n=1 Tax=Saccharopolyspora kobensis TaxID=146035 RepID=A0A1H5TVE4_9PSEU|nr:potassium transporter TrkG [Saccharopolyspora kobensis]SEF66766.1 potassium uptake protein, TrkH family [Saccharopolyspora kobensis]SFC41932.1 potassium uptake protein, TrkH family [Saccharopolyspora kobensis]
MNVLQGSGRRLAAVRRQPAVSVVLGFAGLIAVGTLLLSMPFATESGEPTGLIVALFTATSAACVTGLIVVDTPTYWSTAGEVIILVLIQLGGLGIMTLASLLSLLVFRRFGLRMRLTAQAETKTLGLGDVRRVVGRILLLSLLFELVVAVALTARLVTGYGLGFGRAVYEGVFHAVSAFNNAGFALRTDNLMGFVTDAWFCLPIALAVIAGGLGFPVWLELFSRLRQPRRWTLHTKITVWVTVVLLIGGSVVVTAAEWTNPGTLGPLSWPGKLLAGFFAATMTRTAGFNNLDIAEMHSGTLLVHDVLMFIGGGSAGTAGGIKITTFALLAFVILAEIRGEPTVHVMGRRLPEGVQRQALTIVLIAVGVVVLSVLLLQAITPFGLDAVLFEVVSAFATVGLSTGITAQIPALGQILLVVLMFIGRLGPITLASALALRERGRRYELPEERPIVG